MTATLNIYQRINAVRAQVKHVEKTSRVKAGAGGDYMGVKHDDVTAALRDAMVEHGIICVPSVTESRVVEAGATARGTPIIRYEGRFVVCFINADEPSDVLRVDTDAHANDMGDKAPGKALSYATKAAQLKVFSLETGEDEEQRIEARQSGNVDQLLKHNGAMRACFESITAVKLHLASGDIDAAAEAWAELTRSEERALWVAPSKGGIFTTEEREAVKSTEFTTALKVRRDDSGWYDNPENQQ